MIADDAGLAEVQGGQIEYKRFGRPLQDGPSIVLLHEGLGCVDLWKDFPARLAKATGLGVLAYSRFGYGRSSPASLPRPASYMQDEACIVLPELLEAVGFADGVLLGHSDGATIASIYAASFDDARVRGLVLMAGHFFNEDKNINGIKRITEAYEAGGKLTTGLQKYHGANTDCAFYGWSGLWLAPGYADWNIEALLPAIRVPMLFLQGEQDEYGTLAHMRSAEANSGGRVETAILPDCGHLPQRDQPELVLAKTSKFIGSLLKS